MAHSHDDFGRNTFEDEMEVVGEEPYDVTEQQNPSSYNTRNIILFASVGVVIAIAGFMFSVFFSGGEEQPQSRLSVSEEVREAPREARPPAPIAAKDTTSDQEIDALFGEGPAPQPQVQAAAPVRGQYDLQRQAAFQRALQSRGTAWHTPPNVQSRSANQQTARQHAGTAQVAARRSATQPAPGARPGGGSGHAAMHPASASTSSPDGAWGASPDEPQFAAVANAVQGPLPPHTLSQGTLIPVILESSVNSDLGGTIIARTTTDVYDRTKRHVLIPRGSEVLSRYSNVVSVGQRRLNVAATRLNLPDGRFVNFSGEQMYDPAGRAGLQDQLDRHLLRKAGAVAMLSIAGVATAGAIDRVTDDDGGVVIEGDDGQGVTVPYILQRQSAAAMAAREITREISRILGESAERTLSRPATVKLRSGLRGTLILAEDLDMKRPYYENSIEPDPFGQSPFDGRTQAGPPILPNAPFQPRPKRPDRYAPQNREVRQPRAPQRPLAPPTQGTRPTQTTQAPAYQMQGSAHRTQGAAHADAPSRSAAPYSASPHGANPHMANPHRSTPHNVMPNDASSHVAPPVATPPYADPRYRAPRHAQSAGSGTPNR